MKFAEDNKDFLIREYTKNNNSTYWISERLNTYPNKIRRALRFLGVSLKSKSEAQSVAIESGRHCHPTKGRKRTEEERVKISDAMSVHWSTLSDEEKERRSDMARKQWEGMSENEKEEFRSLAAEAVRRAGKEGSKTEKFVQKGLTEHGYDVIFHMKGLIPNERLEVDLLIPSLKTVIEIDGPAHFLPIWGETNLQRNIVSDSKKSGLILSCGFVMIRVKHVKKSVSFKDQRMILGIIIAELTKIEEKFPSKANRYIEIEVTDDRL